ncbi:MAG: VWA domain-containing protein [Candidatus Gastranaerophilales bacterium]|nr:VWA domain-containing protein [Candidatus Gastranaerophilales bacterium]
MIKRIFSITFLLIIFSVGACHAAKYKINTSGVIKTNGKIIQTQTNMNPYNVYTPQTYNATKQVAQVQIVNLVMDYSGSMSNCIEKTKSIMSYIIAQIPQTTRVGLRVFGQSQNTSNSTRLLGTIKSIKKENKKYKVIANCNPAGRASGACSATEQVASITTANANSLIAGMNSVRIGTSTPMVYGLDRAINQDFAYLDKTTPKKVILITDGGENCGGDPCAFAKNLIKQRSDVHVDIILVSSDNDEGLACLASTTGGKVYNINNLSNLQSVLTQAITSQPGQIKQSPQNKTQYEFYKD